MSELEKNCRYEPIGMNFKMPTLGRTFRTCVCVCREEQKEGSIWLQKVVLGTVTDVRADQTHYAPVSTPHIGESIRDSAAKLAKMNTRALLSLLISSPQNAGLFHFTAAGGGL